MHDLTMLRLPYSPQRIGGTLNRMLYLIDDIISITSRIVNVKPSFSIENR